MLSILTIASGDNGAEGNITAASARRPRRFLKLADRHRLLDVLRELPDPLN
ncbi:hypothetical protein [Paraburkholderia sp. PGU19]|uniref:hypothetical protein n=1 Tax=Paraburkholderia sp. PGU19 TaxID=2735434 RepID=UPI0015DB1E2E|nr:hypothetical protein [Paraburkholderia sp. PGU19]